MNAASDFDIVSALVDQVIRASGGKNEREVTTIISLPMWEAFLRGINEPEDLLPTPWLGESATLRVYGSETIVVESPNFFSVSYRHP